MSEPITRAEFRDFLIHKERVDLLHPGTSPALIFDSWCEQHRTESASPPRVPVGITGPVLPYESGPGQPIDIAARLDSASRMIGMYLHGDYASTALEAAAEIRRLRAESESRYRAGVEAAAQAAATYAYNLSPREWSVSNLLAAIRALADKPALSDKGG